MQIFRRPKMEARWQGAKAAVAGGLAGGEAKKRDIALGPKTRPRKGKSQCKTPPQMIHDQTDVTERRLYFSHLGYPHKLPPHCRPIVQGILSGFRGAGARKPSILH